MVTDIQGKPNPMKRMALLMMAALAVATAGGGSRKDSGQGVKNER